MGLKATASDRFRTNFDRREEYLGPDFAAADWVLGTYLGGDLRPAPRALEDGELERLDQRDTFRLFFGLPVQKVRRERIAYFCSILGTPTLPARLVRSGIVTAMEQGERLITRIQPSLRKALDEKEQRHSLRVEVLSRYGIRLPSPTFADRADLWVAWEVATWLEEGQVLEVLFRTPLDAQIVSRRIRERDQFVCAWCGGFGTTNDHLLLRSHGGLDTMLNGVCSCSACNQRRGDTGLRRWVRRLSEHPSHWTVDALAKRPRASWLRGRRLGRSVRLPRYGKIFYP